MKGTWAPRSTRDLTALQSELGIIAGTGKSRLLLCLRPRFIGSRNDDRSSPGRHTCFRRLVSLGMGGRRIMGGISLESSAPQHGKVGNAVS